MTDWTNPTDGSKGDGESSLAQQPCPISIAELVAQTAAEFIVEQQAPAAGYSYIEEYGMYYSSQDGYFYDPNSSLFYHPSTQSYYKFNEATNQHEIYSPSAHQQLVELPSWTKESFKKRATTLLGGEFVANADQDDIDLIELTLDLVDKCSFLAGDYSNRKLAKRALLDAEGGEEIDGILVKKAHNERTKELNDELSSSDDEEQQQREWMEQEMARRAMEEEIAREAPCIRLVEQPANTLHIVTIMGARVGFGPGMDIELGRNGSRAERGEERKAPLFTIQYVDESGIEGGGRGYWLMPSTEDGEDEEEAEGAETTVKLNGREILPNSAMKCALSHEDNIEIGNECFLLLHIHNGLNTCQACEPGLFKADEIAKQNGQKAMKKFSKNSERRRQMRAMKEQYGLLEEDNNHQQGETSHKYLDRAKMRRKMVGNDDSNEKKRIKRNTAGGIYAGCAAAPIAGCSTESVQLRVGSVASQSAPAAKIEKDNKGFQLLKGMGWREGQGLGKNNQGIQGPIIAMSKNDRVGLGCVGQKGQQPTMKQIRTNGKHDILAKTKMRYDQIGRRGGGTQQKDSSPD